ncbi:MAG: zinc ribbon domain-containing protein [Kouleothrix sp.]|nr:zinc ribbon domain-containing protein [Kouleothrix sp.]
MKCPTCGAENEAANRFCEQCGSRLESSGGVQQAQVDTSSAPTAAGPTCPSCGAAVIPGEAFCDECGAALNNVAPAAAAPIPIAYDAPTIAAPPLDGSQSVVCPACGHQNLPGDQFCDNCGAALPAGGAAAAPAESATVSAAAAPQPSEIALSQAPTTEQPMITADASGAQATYETERKRIEDEIARQQQIITQFEQMLAMFGAAAPAAVSQGLAEARDAKARAEAELAALQPPPPAVDPAEVARIESEIGRQQQIITQFEQMLAMFGAAAPAAVSQGLAEARDAKARAEAELAALQGGAAAPAAPIEAKAAQPEAQPRSPGDAPAAAIPPAAPVAQTAVSSPPAEAIPPPAPVAPSAPPMQPTPAQAAPAAPRLVFDDGKELALPADKREIIVGREDPISGIFPEVDLTPFGGETGGVSRQHARLNHTNGQWTITDLNSTNYTRVDGAKIEPSVSVQLKSGSRLQFGRVAMTFQA